MFKCRDNCSDCCGVVSIPIETWVKYRHVITTPLNIHKINDMVYVFNEGLKCAFSLRNRCLIYPDRPNVCKKFGEGEDLPCPFIKPNGNPWSKAMTKRLLRKGDKKYNNFVTKLKGIING